MRVALLTLYPIDGSRIQGGVRAVTFNLVRGLRSYSDLDIHVVHCHSDVDADRMVQDGNVSIHYLAQPRKHIRPNLMRAIGQVRRKLREIRPDVVNSHLSQFTVAAMDDYPTVWTIHGLAFREAQIYNRRLSDRLRHRLIMRNVRRGLRGVTDIIAISPYVIEEYGSMTTARWHRVDNPIADDFFALPNREHPGRILLAGSVDERKNALLLLQALTRVRERFPGVELHIAGRVNSPAYARQLRDFVRAQGVEDVVHFRGLLDYEQMLDAYAGCSVMALTSLQETQPMAVIEAMAAAKPVVSTRVGGVGDLIADGHTGFIVEPGDVEALALRLGQLLGDEGLRRRMGAAAREAASSRFRIKVVASRYVEIYRGMLRARVG